MAVSDVNTDDTVDVNPEVSDTTTDDTVDVNTSDTTTDDTIDINPPEPETSDTETDDAVEVNPDDKHYSGGKYGGGFGGSSSAKKKTKLIKTENKKEVGFFNKTISVGGLEFMPKQAVLPVIAGTSAFFIAKGKMKPASVFGIVLITFFIGALVSKVAFKEQKV